MRRSPTDRPYTPSMRDVPPDSSTHLSRSGEWPWGARWPRGLASMDGACTLDFGPVRRAPKPTAEANLSGSSFSILPMDGTLSGAQFSAPLFCPLSRQENRIFCLLLSQSPAWRMGSPPSLYPSATSFCVDTPELKRRS